MINLHRATAATLTTLLVIGGATAVGAGPAAANKSRVEVVTFQGPTAYQDCLRGRTNVARWPGVTIRSGCYPVKSARPGQPTAYAFQFTR